jgi:hypothetical protein
MTESTRNIRRAACVAALYELDRAGYLEGLTLQEIADLLDVGHRSTAMRYLRDVEAVKALIPEIKAALRHAAMVD